MSLFNTQLNAEDSENQHGCKLGATTYLQIPQWNVPLPWHWDDCSSESWQSQSHSVSTVTLSSSLIPCTLMMKDSVLDRQLELVTVTVKLTYTVEWSIGFIKAVFYLSGPLGLHMLYHIFVNCSGWLSANLELYLGFSESVVLTVLFEYTVHWALLEDVATATVFNLPVALPVDWFWHHCTPLCPAPELACHHHSGSCRRPPGLVGRHGAPGGWRTIGSEEDISGRGHHESFSTTEMP